jgi:putative restriction endonuclease
MRGYVGVTDNDWYEFLAQRPEITLVNFWRPGGGKEFRALAEGDYFFFKTHKKPKKPDRLVGGGYYSGFAAAPVSEAWHLFGEANGVPSLEQMRERIAHYRRTPIGAGEDPVIGCIFIGDVAFFPRNIVIPPPPGFASNIVQGKTYDTTAAEVNRYFADVMRLLPAASADIGLGNDETWEDTGPVFGTPQLSPTRLAQHAFKEVLLTAYNGRCAITGSRIRPALQGAHILPVRAGAGTGSTTDCCSEQMSTRCSTAATPGSIRGTGCGSARGSATSSATAISSTREPVRLSRCPTGGPTARRASSWNGTSARSSRRRSAAHPPLIPTDLITERNLRCTDDPTRRRW